MHLVRCGVAVVAAATVIGAGTPAQAVIGGGAVESAAYPWLAAIGSPLFPVRPGGQFCAGALIAPDRVLTAAHCAVFAEAAPAALTVTFGRDDLTDDNGITMGVREIRVHPRFRVSVFDGDLSYHNDVAVLVLAAPMALTTVKIDAPHGDFGTIVGWGATAAGDSSNTGLRAAPVPLVPACTAGYGAEFDPVEAFCAGSPTTDTGEFDSGGPLLIDGRLVGITSWGRGAAHPGYPGIYARVPSLDF